MAGRVDLEAAAKLFGEPLPGSSNQVAVRRRQVALAMVAELRAAREVVRLTPRPPWFKTPTAEYVAALAAYDQVTDQPATAGRKPGVGS